MTDDATPPGAEPSRPAEPNSVELPPDAPAGHEARLDGAASGPKPQPAVEAAGLPPPALVPAPPVPRPNYLFLAVVSLVTLALDLGTKAWAKAHLEEARTFADRHLEVVKDYVVLTFAKNRGGAWGLLQDEPEAIRRPFFLGISVLAIAFIVSLYRKLTPRQWALKWGLPLVLGGALGNLVNRIQYNYVVDFIDCSLRWDGREHHWPTFNVADIAIVVGVLLMAIDMFTPAPRTTKDPTPPPGSPQPPSPTPAESAAAK